MSDADRLIEQLNAEKAVELLEVPNVMEELTALMVEVINKYVLVPRLRDRAIENLCLGFERLAKKAGAAIAETKARIHDSEGGAEGGG